jgi:hypothetical protein
MRHEHPYSSVLRLSNKSWPSAVKVIIVLFRSCDPVNASRKEFHIVLTTAHLQNSSLW